MIQTLRNFWSRNVTGGVPDGDYRGASALKAEVGLAAGWTAATTAAGYAIGATHQARDVVTHEQIPYKETVTVQVGTHTENGGFHYHYDLFNGKWDYSWDPLWSHDEPTYETRETGRTLVHDVTHHTVGAPYTAVGGAIMGLGVGVVTGTLGVIIAEMIRS